MENQSKKHTANGNQSKYGNKSSFNNIPPRNNEELVPILVTKAIRKDPALDQNNIETWHIHGHKIPVAFAPVSKSCFDGCMKFFWSQVRTYIATAGTEEFLKENGHSDDLSYTKFTDDADSDNDSTGFDPGQTKGLEDTVLLRIIIKDLIKQIHTINPKYGRILDLICEDYTKGQILEELHLGKSQGYADIKAAQELAKKLYYGE